MYYYEQFNFTFSQIDFWQYAMFLKMFSCFPAKNIVAMYQSDCWLKAKFAIFCECL